MKTEITPNEKAVIQGIAQNEYNWANYGEPEDAFETNTYIWTLEDGLYKLLDGMKMPQGKALSGTISSLTKKGLVKSDSDGPKNDRGIKLTAAGFEVWKNQIKK